MRPGMDTHQHEAPIGKRQMDGPHRGGEIDRGQEAVQVLAHQDPGDGLHDHEDQKQQIDSRLEHATGCIAATEQALEPHPVQPVMGDEQTQHQRSGNFVESLPDEGIGHQHWQQDHHDCVDQNSLAFHLRSPTPQANC